MTTRALGVSFLAGLALATTVLLTAGALPDELGEGRGDGISIFCGEGAATCDVSVGMRAEWLDEETAKSLGVEPVRWISIVRVPSAKLASVLTGLLTGQGCTVSDARPPAARSKVPLPAPCEVAE